MNLLAKKKIGWLFAIGVLFIGCKDEIGLELSPDVQQTKIEFIEFNLPTTNLYFDSLRTDEGTSLLVGEYSDDIFGSIQATGYSEFFYTDGPFPSFFYDDDGLLIDNTLNISFDSLFFESMTISLRISEILATADPLIQNIDFFKLEDEVFSDVIYLADRVIPLGESLGSDVDSFNPFAVSLLDLSVDTLIAKFRLNDSYGQEIFDFVKNLDPNDSDSLTAGKKRFPGIGFVSNGSTGIVSYELTNSLSNIEIHAKGLKGDSTYVIKFQFASSNNFNHLVRDRQGSDFATLTDRRALDVSNDFVYLNPIAGVMPRIDLSPYLEFVKENEEGEIIVQRAELSIGTKPNEDFISRVETSKFYFSRVDSSDLSDLVFNINWSGIALDPFSTLLQTDNTYRGSFPIDIIAELDSTSNIFTSFPNVFFQDLLDQTQTGSDIYSDNLVMVSPINYGLGRSVIYKDSVKLQIFYIRFQ